MAKEERKEVYFKSLVIAPEGMPIEELLRKNNFRPSIVGIHAVVDNNFTAEHLAEYAQLITYTDLDPAEIYVAETMIDDKDRFFAQRFGCKIAPRFAYIGLSADDMEVWIGSVFLSYGTPDNPGHPLAGIDVPNSALLLTDSIAYNWGLVQRRLRSYAFTASSFYVRLTAEDRPSALSEICTIFGDAEISMQGILQPQAPEDSPTADIGILFYPTVTADLYTALQKVQATTACQNVGTVLKAFI